MEKEKKQKEKMYDVEYDARDVQMISIDGADIEIGRLLFFHELPTIETEDGAKYHYRRKCSVDLRMTTTQLRRIARLIAAQILCFESEKQQVAVQCQKPAPQEMFA